MSADIEELIGRLEKATGPDRKIDGQIFQAMGGDAWRNAVLLASEPSGCPLEMAEREARERYAPRYTGSIDAARALLLPEHSFGGLAQVSPRDWYMLICSRTDLHARWEGEAATAENAICIAALKALSATNTGK